MTTLHRALVVGAGRMGSFHRKVLSDFGYDVSTVDPEPGRADYLTIPARGDFAVVCVAVPIKHLADEAARWAGHTGWLLIEKPMATSVEDAAELAALLDGQRVAVGYVERFNPHVRRLADELSSMPPPTHATFVRHNQRPSANVALDLRTHDIDLARYLDLQCPTTFDCAAGKGAVRRLIEVQCGPHTARAYLLAHNKSPLHAQWFAFLSDRFSYARPPDAVAALTALWSAEVLR